MLVRQKGKARHYRTVWWESGKLKMIEQNLLPFEFRIFASRNHSETAKAISEMTVRGAGAIGAAAGFGIGQAFCEAKKKRGEEMWKYCAKARKEIEETRPTAVNLFHATQRVWESARNSSNPAESALKEAKRIADEDSEACRKIGENGKKLLRGIEAMETHCNAGWLAFTDWGSALSPVYAAKREGNNVFVFVDETRPRGQGARLTAWELKNEGVRHAVIADNAGAHYMQSGKIGLMITGADRIAQNGDTANKIGTLEKAICAKEFGIPFYIAAPESTIDKKYKSGKGMPIEERDGKEVLFQSGLDSEGKMREIRVSNPGSNALNPGFDVTPARLIKGIITENGIVRPGKGKFE
ncbi:MAG: S-methyl-5-thioribose-1-phosphate isomerase [archaeon]